MGTQPDPEDLIRHRNLYWREKSRLRASKKRRRITGEDWEVRTDGVTGHPFWFNVDTGESTWDKPSILLQLESLDLATRKMWGAIPYTPLMTILRFLLPYPDRMACSALSWHWNRGATDISFVRHVYPVEMGAYTRDERKIDPNHYRTIKDAVTASLPGDTIGK